MSIGKTIIISILILAGAAVITVVIFLTEPEAKREGATRETAMLVEVDTARQGSYRPLITATGSVIPEQDIQLSPRVTGEVIRLSPSFIPGGYVKQGEILLQIDPSDYQIALATRQTELHQAEAELELEMGRQDVALKDYQLLNETLEEEDRALVLREPQLNAARSRVRAAEAAVERAELDLQRTTVRAPYDAHILSRNANLGSLVSPGDNLGRLVGVDHYWVITTVPLSRLRWLNFPESGQKGSEVIIRNRTAWEPGEHRIGRLYRLVGALEEQTRLARIIVEVEDPLNFLQPGQERPPLMIGAFVEVEIPAEKIENAIRLNRDYLRKGNTVWVMAGDSLQIRNPEILLTDATHAYITGGLVEGDLIVKTNLTTVVEGARLRSESEESVATSEDQE